MNDLACISGVDLLMDYLEGELPGDVRAAIEAHVAGCERCVAFLDSYRAAPRITREATIMELPADLEASLMAAVRAARRQL
jgi:anti-sigma factor RsiW